MKVKELFEGVNKTAVVVSSILVIGGAVTSLGGLAYNYVSSRIDDKITSKLDVIEEKIDSIEQEEHKNALTATRCEMMLLMENEPHNHQAIYNLGAAYFIELKGDTYMVEKFTNWAKSEGVDIENLRALSPEL